MSNPINQQLNRKTVMGTVYIITMNNIQVRNKYIIVHIMGIEIDLGFRLTCPSPKEDRTFSPAIVLGYV